MDLCSHTSAFLIYVSPVFSRTPFSHTSVIHSESQESPITSITDPVALDYSFNMAARRPL